MRAVVTVPGGTPGLALRDVPPPAPGPDEMLVRVTAFSLNAGETRTALGADEAYVPGWDFAGVVEEPAATGSPDRGARVFGVVLPRGSWAEYVVVRPGLVAEIPAGVPDAVAGALPVAATTALLALESAGPLIDRRVLVTGAAGGVGRFACQLATYAGARVSAVSRRAGLADRLTADGVRLDGVFRSVPDAAAAGGYDVVLDGVGGDALAVALGALAADGVCVSFGNGSRQPTTFDAHAFNRTRGARLSGLWLGNVLTADCAPILARLADLVRREVLRVPLDATLPWTEVAAAADRLTRRTVDGKIVLTLS